MESKHDTRAPSEIESGAWERGAWERGRHILERSPLAGLPEASCEALLKLGKVEILPRRHRLAQQDELPQSFAVVGSGRVSLERKGSDHVFPLGHRGPGDFVGESALGGAPAQESAVVADDAEALVIPALGFRVLLGEDRLLQGAMSRALLQVQRDTEARLIVLLLRNVKSRLASFLLEAEGRWGAPHPAGTVITALFTHAEIAQFIGSTRETITLELGKLRRAGLIDLDKRRVVIRDRAGLALRVEGP